MTLFFSLLSSVSSLLKRSRKRERQIPHLCVTTINDHLQQWLDVFDCFKTLFILSSVTSENVIVTLATHVVTFDHSKSKAQFCEIVSKEIICNIKVLKMCLNYAFIYIFSTDNLPIKHKMSDKSGTSCNEETLSPGSSVSVVMHHPDGDQLHDRMLNSGNSAIHSAAQTQGSISQVNCFCQIFIILKLQ